jgi:hypothetical protein
MIFVHAEHGNTATPAQSFFGLTLDIGHPAIVSMIGASVEFCLLMKFRDRLLGS